jgi:hypothetical protein
VKDAKPAARLKSHTREADLSNASRTRIRSCREGVMKGRVKLTIVVAAFIMMMMLGAMPAMAKVKDVNRNGIPDWWEIKYHMSVKRNLAKTDVDKDGLTAINEYRAGTNPLLKDTNHNGVPDGRENPDKDGLVNIAEVAAHTNPRVADTNHNGVLDGNEDPDKDRLTNAQEYRCRTNPLLGDTNRNGVTDFNEDLDNDGLTNGNEFIEGDNPSVSDSDHDGITDGQEVSGFVSGYDPASGVLTIVSLGECENSYDVNVTDATVIKWADVVTTDTVPTLDNLKPGAIVNQVVGKVQADGTVVATLIKLMPTPPTDAIIARVEWFCSDNGVLALSPAVDDSCDYQVIVDDATQYAWADGVVSNHDATADDLLEGAGVTDLEVTYSSDGDMLATKIVLVPSYAAGDSGSDSNTDSTDTSSTE